MEFPAYTVASLTAQALGDAFGASFEYNPGSPGFASQSIAEQRYLDAATDCGARRRGRLPGLYTDDTQQALVLCWCWREFSLRGIDPSVDAEKMGRAFLHVCRKMGDLHRGTGRNFRQALVGPTPCTAGMGAAMRIGPVATLLEAEGDVAPWCMGVSAATTTHPLGQAPAGYFGQLVWRASRGMSCDTTLPVPLGVEPELADAWTFIVQVHQALLDSVPMPEILALLKERADPHMKAICDGYGVGGMLWAVMSATCTTSFSDALIMACRYGGDTDTVCAMTGALYGAAYGLTDIESWMLVTAEWDTLDPHTWHPIHTEAKLLQREQAHLRSQRFLAVLAENDLG